MSNTIRHAHGSSGASRRSVGGQRVSGVIRHANVSRSTYAALMPVSVAVAQSLAEWAEDEFSSVPDDASDLYGPDCESSWDNAS